MRNTVGMLEFQSIVTCLTCQIAAAAFPVSLGWGLSFVDVATLNCILVLPARLFLYGRYFFRHSMRKYLYEDSTKFDNGDPKFDELGTKCNPEVMKYRP